MPLIEHCIAREFNRFHARVDFHTGCYVNIYEGARRTRSYVRTYVRTGTNHGDDGNPVPQFLVSKTYLGGKKNEKMLSDRNNFSKKTNRPNCLNTQSSDWI